MRDEIDGRLWVAHHDQFALSVEEALAALRSSLARVGRPDGAAAQLLALAIAFALTGLAFTSAAA